MTFTSGIEKLCFDGELKATGTLTGTLVSNDYLLRIGGMTNKPYGLAGQIDDVRIYNRELSPTETEIQAMQ